MCLEKATIESVVEEGEKTIEIIKNSFLNQLIKEGYTSFDYEFGKLYSSNSSKKVVASLQPSIEKIEELIQKITEAAGKKFNTLNPLIQVVNPAIFLTAHIDHNNSLFLHIGIVNSKSYK